MEDEVTTEPGTTEPGQVAEGSEGAQTTQAAPAGSEGQSTAGTTDSGPQEDAFFDPKTVPDDLKPAYKQMQSAFTKRMQEIASHRDKVEAYDAFMQDPVTQLRQMATQYGFQVVPHGQSQDPASQAEPGNDQPQTWDDVYKAAEERAYNRIMGDLKPVIGELQTMKATAIEKQLDELDGTWRQYEPKMKELLKEIPQLAKNPAQLYRMAVPEDVLMQRATQAALKKLEAKTSAGAVSGGSTTTRQSAGDLAGQGPRTFAESVAAAKKQLAEQGIVPP